MHGCMHALQLHSTLADQSVHAAEDADIDALRDRLGAAAMPEQLFGNSYLRLTHSSGSVIHFNAADALAAWVQEALPPAQVSLPCSDLGSRESDRRQG